MINFVKTFNNLTIEEKINVFKLISDRHIFSSNLTFDEKVFLHLLSKLIGTNSTFVEIGTYLCGSACIISNANTSSQIYCFDTFDDIPAVRNHNKLINLSLGQGNSRSIESVKKWIEDFKNITLIKVPHRDYVESHWDTEIDLYFEDGNHWDPTLTKNIEFWSKYVKMNGYMLIHDFRPQLAHNTWGKYPDIENLVYRLKEDKQWNYLGIVSSLVVFQKI